MSIDTLTTFLGWATVINVALLVLATSALIALREPVTRIHSRLFGLDEKELGRAYFRYLAQFKIATIVSSVTPYVALKIIA